MFIKLGQLFVVVLICQVYGEEEEKQINQLLREPQYHDFQYHGGDSDNDEIDDWLYSSYYDYTDSDEDNFSGHRKHLFTRGTQDYDHRTYFKTCKKSVLMRPNKKVRIVSIFHGVKQYLSDTTCEWNFLGDAKCTPQIFCETIDLRPPASLNSESMNSNCDKEYLLIMDGIDAGQKICEENSGFSKPKTPVKGNSLFVIFKTSKNTNFDRLYKGIQCEVSCIKTADVDNADKLPQENELFKIEDKCECGIRKDVKTRIVGGTGSTPFEFPWLVGIVQRGSRSILCGGSLINSQHVLTAAHCFAQSRTSLKTVKSSTKQILVHVHNALKRDSDEDTQRFSITEVNCHPYYGHNARFDFDACILTLDRSVDIIEHRPVCLSSIDTDRSKLNDVLLTVAGWGSIHETSQQGSPTVNEVQVPAIPGSRCIKENGAKNVVESRMICAGFREGTKDACQGDSGGPFIKEDGIGGGQTKAHQVGLVSWGVGCARPRTSGVYTFIPAVLPWIRKTAMNGTWCKP